MKKVRYFLEYIAILPFYQLLAWIPLAWGRGVLGWLAMRLGQFLPVHKIMMINLALAFPDKPLSERQALARKVWQHLGYLVAEHPKVGTMTIGKDIFVQGIEHIHAIPVQTPVIFISGHVGNWELFNAAAAKAGVDFYPVYRRANNPYIERHIQRYRPHQGAFIPKGSDGAKQLLKVLKQGGRVGMLLDQKMKEGSRIPFFGVPAQTATNAVELAWRYNAVIIPVYTYRAESGSFAMVVEPPLALPKKNEPAALEQALTHINQRLEAWIRAHPEQWLWLHRRWPKENY
jgi:KDO2-lipid IV(A) lauroyltransferase